MLIFLTDKKQQTFHASDGFGTYSLKVMANQERHTSIGLMILQTKLRCLAGGQVVQCKGPVRPSKIRALTLDYLLPLTVYDFPLMLRACG